MTQTEQCEKLRTSLQHKQKNYVLTTYIFSCMFQDSQGLHFCTLLSSLYRRRQTWDQRICSIQSDQWVEAPVCHTIHTHTPVIIHTKPNVHYSLAEEDDLYRGGTTHAILTQPHSKLYKHGPGRGGTCPWCPPASATYAIVTPAG